MAGNLSKALDGTPLVDDATSRDVRFPLATRTQNQRVYRLDTKVTERWDGSAWTVDPIDYANIANAPSVDAAFGNNTITTSGLDYGYNAGTAVVDGAFVRVAADTVALADDTDNFVERTYDGVVSANATAFSSDKIAMAQVTTVAGAITAILDFRSQVAPPLPYPVLASEAGVVDVRYEVGNVLRYGAVLDGTTDDTAALQAAITAANSQAVIRARTNGDVGATSVSLPEVVIPYGVCKITTAVSLGLYNKIRTLKDAFIKQTTAGAFIFTSPSGGSGFLLEVRGVHFIGPRHMNLTRANLDTSMNLFEDCTFSGADSTTFANYINLISSTTLFRRCRVLGAARWLDLLDCDRVILEHCWINGYDTTLNKKPANSASIRAQSSYPTNPNGNTGCSLSIENCLFVPEDQFSPANANTRWIDLYDFVDLQVSATRFGGENSGFPIVYTFGLGAAAQVAYPYIQSGGINITGSMICSGASGRADRGVVVFQTSVPHRITIRDCYYLLDGYVINDTQMSPAIATWLTNVADVQHPQITICIENITGFGFAALSSTALKPFTRTFNNYDGTSVTSRITEIVPAITTDKVTIGTATEVTPLKVRGANGGALLQLITAAGVERYALYHPNATDIALFDLITGLPVWTNHAGGDFTIEKSASVTGAFQHSGSTFGVYGHSLVSQQAAPSPAATQGAAYVQADVQSIAGTVNQLITILQNLGFLA